MGPAIGEILPLALGIAISPIPIIAAILMLLSPRARSTSLGFLIGWLLGITVAVVVFTVLSSVLPDADESGSRPIAATIKVVLGALLLLLALRQWRGRPKDGEEPRLPTWMSAIDSMTVTRGLLLGFALSAINPKNLLMAVSAGLSIGGAELSVGEATVVILVFVVLAGSTVLVPVIAYLVASKKLREPLDDLRSWLVQNNATIMSILLLVIGVVLIGKGLAQY
jgi:threonine/homoserine/homoserine lactone efflux protein